jgi:large subunit ribosomal protein L24
MPRKYNTQKKLHVKKDDEVLVIAGNDKGKKDVFCLYIPNESECLWRVST